MNFFFPVCSVSLDCRLISAFETSSFPKCGHFLNLPLPASSVSVERAGIHQYRLFWSSLLGFFQRSREIPGVKDVNVSHTQSLHLTNALSGSLSAIVSILNVGV